MEKYVTILFTFVLLISIASTECYGEENVQYYFNKGAEYFQAGKYDEAIEMYKKGLELEPNSALGYNFIGMAYRFKYNTTRNAEYKNKEIEAFKKAVELDPTFWGAMINLGATYYYMGEKEKAALYFKKALEINPYHPEKAQIEKMIQEGQ